MERNLALSKDGQSTTAPVHSTKTSHARPSFHCHDTTVDVTAKYLIFFILCKLNPLVRLEGVATGVAFRQVDRTRNGEDVGTNEVHQVRQIVRR